MVRGLRTRCARQETKIDSNTSRPLCELTGILAPIIYLDLLGLSEADARAALLGAFRCRKPSSPPIFPCDATSQPLRKPPPQLAYPGNTKAISPSIAETLPSVAESQNSKIDYCRGVSGERKAFSILSDVSPAGVCCVPPFPWLSIRRGSYLPTSGTRGERSWGLHIQAERPSC